MIYNGETISLKPSVGNWSFDCKSHYWIINNDVEWSSKWSDEKIRKVRKMESSERQEYYTNKNSENIDNDSSDLIDIPVSKPIKKRWFQNLVFWK